ncbi:glycoside hydrolase family 38 C-terminal domain-containing protein [Lacticaseibacillus chiayiensis]|uniref:glycoside hydrolase family 38 N-terminal domain-containing protein n=1 Tax=Lacticaseibacillus chiayiensis TaxID=2100821 RepID=UPI001011A7A0|nr:glycoside hydrolase family 38 C-terminal domain-containing protein [Lacticaseibacillus chiayiensis]RXT59005.1 alpha-mannosidase [Lacticaseibacillus chiayiensis]
MVTAYLVNHTHWDREWYFTTMDSLVLSEQLFTEVLDELETHADANFCLDGQTSVVDEYVEVHPEAKSRIQKLVATGRLFIGPWYTQTDALIPDAESIIRNLVIGINDTKKNYGQPMMVGYLPDTFGFNAQMPTLLRQVGIDNFVFWRGTNYNTQLKSLYFKWTGLSGKQVYAANFPFGYFTAQLTPESKLKMNQFVKERFDPAADFAANHGQNKDILMPSGIDQMNIIKNIGATVKELNAHSKYHTVISSYPEFIDILRKKKLPDYQGELRLPTYARVHRTIGSVRHEIKCQNFLLEQKVLKRVEPLTVIARQAGLTIGNGLLIKLWKKLLECQPHDTLGGSVSDNVATDILHRFKEANEIADGIENMIEKKLAEFLKLGPNQVLLFNTQPYEVYAYKSVQLLTASKQVRIEGMSDQVIESAKHFPERHHVLMMTPRGKEFTDEPEYYQITIKGKVKLPALGYKVFEIEESDQPLPEPQISEASHKATITNERQSLTFKDGHLNFQTNSREITDVLQLVDSANDGDTYDYSPLVGDHEQILPFEQAVNVQIGDSSEALVIEGSASLPKTLADRTSAQPHYGSLSYRLTVKFNEHGMIEGHLVVDNQVLSHRLRLKFNPQVATDKVMAEIQAGYVTTKNQPIPDDWAQHYDEKPVNIYNFDKTVNLADAKTHFTFWGAGQKEYQYKDRALFITLMATTSQLGKSNLAWRPGRASGDTTNQGHVMMPTPLAEELGNNQFDFAFALDDQPFNLRHTNELTQAWLAPSLSYQKQSLNLFVKRLDNKIWETEDDPSIPKELSVLNIDTSLDVTALYPAYSEEDAYVLRIQNMTDSPQPLPKRLTEKGTMVNALEEPVKPSSVIDPFDLVSIKIKF